MGNFNPRFRNELNVPKTKPYSNDTWEVSGELPGNSAQSELVPMQFPAPCRIVGLYPSLTINGVTGGGLLLPTTDDILVLLDFNQQRRYTASIGQTSQALKGTGFVTLAALNTVIRDLNIEVDNARPQAGFQFRWKRFIQGTPIYVDQIISLALFVEIND